MHRGGVDSLRERASEFLYESESAFRSGRYNLACFLSDQAVQLYIKSALLELVGDYPRTYSIRMLLNEVLKCRPSTEPEGLIREDRAGISSLEHAYIMARDSAKEYDREDAEALIILAKKIIGSIGRLLGDELHGHPQAEG